MVAAGIEAAAVVLFIAFAPLRPNLRVDVNRDLNVFFIFTVLLPGFLSRKLRIYLLGSYSSFSKRDVLEGLNFSFLKGAAAALR